MMMCEACGRKTVLLIDDSEFDIIPLSSLLTSLCQVNVEQAIGGQEGIDKFKADQAKTCCTDYFRLVFTDMNMPDVDGR